MACLTGRVPFPRDSDVAIINAHLHDPPPSITCACASCPSAVDAVIARGMAKDPSARYPDCRAFVEDLRRCAQGHLDIHRPTPAAPRDRRALLLIGGGLLAVGIIGVIGFAVGFGRIVVAERERAHHLGSHLTVRER